MATLNDIDMVRFEWARAEIEACERRISELQAFIALLQRSGVETGLYEAQLSIFGPNAEAAPERIERKASPVSFAEWLRVALDGGPAGGLTIKQVVEKLYALGWRPKEGTKTRIGDLVGSELARLAKTHSGIEKTGPGLYGRMRQEEF